MAGLFFASSALAADAPRTLWLKAKCAVCHAEDGSGATPEGRKLNVPDLRGDQVQKKKDDELATAIRHGHSRMPSFKVQLNEHQIATLVSYIRLIARK